MITNFQGHNLKIQHRTFFYLNGLKNGMTKKFENSLKSMQIFQILMGDMNFRESSQKTKRPQQCMRSVKGGLSHNMSENGQAKMFNTILKRNCKGWQYIGISDTLRRRGCS